MAKAILTTKVDPTYDDLPDTVTRLINPERRLLAGTPRRAAAFAVSAFSSQRGVQGVTRRK